MEIPAETKHRFSLYLCYCLLAIVVISFALIRFRLRQIPLERDEGEYAYAGQLLLKGLPPYQLVYSAKLPGTYAAYAAMLVVFGQSAAGIHIGLLLVNAATTVILFLIMASLFGRLAALAAATSYAVLSADPYMYGLAGHATHFVVFFAVAGIWFLLKGIDSPKPILLFAAGLLFGMAFLMKQPGMLFSLWAVIYLLRQGGTGPTDWRALSKRLGALIGGAALPYALACLLMLRAAEFRNFWFWTFTYVRHYGTEVPVRVGLALLYRSGSLIVKSAPWIWAISLVGVTAGLWNARARRNSFFTNSLLLFSFVAVSAGMYYRPHYFILMLPAVSVLMGIAISSATEILAARAGHRLIPAIPALLFAAAVLSSLYSQRKILFQMTPQEVCEKLYRPNGFPEAFEVANYVRSHTQPGESIAVLGSEPEIYFYSHRRSATGYIYMYPLLEPQSYALEMQGQMMQEIESSRPAMVVLVNVPSSWIAFANFASMQGIAAWARPYLADNYVRNGVVEIGDPSTYLWGDAARGYEPKAGYSFLVFKRKQQ
jgi:hypothetical protein